MLCVVTEETDRVIGERRLSFLRSLASALGTAIVEADVLAAIKGSLSQNQKDLPFTLTYILGDDRYANLACSSGIDIGHPAAKPRIGLGEPGSLWPVGELLSQKVPVTVENLEQRFGQLPSGAWSVAPERAVVVPLQRQGQDRPAGFFVAGINPYRPLDAEYIGFIELIAGQIAAGLANARAYEQERRRAEALTELDRAKTIFFSNVSHEFRTPRTLMLGPLEDILNKRDWTLAPEDLRQIGMGRAAGDRLTPEITREVCQRTASNAMVTGSIAPLGTQYVIGLKAMICATGDMVAEVQEQAASKEQVLNALSHAAINLRSKLGESLSSVQKYATPVEDATTSSLEALKAYSLGRKMFFANGNTAALPYLKRAVELTRISPSLTARWGPCMATSVSRRGGRRTSEKRMSSGKRLATGSASTLRQTTTGR